MRFWGFGAPGQRIFRLGCAEIKGREWRQRSDMSDSARTSRSMKSPDLAQLAHVRH